MLLSAFVSLLNSGCLFLAVAFTFGQAVGGGCGDLVRRGNGMGKYIGLKEI